MSLVALRPNQARQVRRTAGPAHTPEQAREGAHRSLEQRYGCEVIPDVSYEACRAVERRLVSNLSAVCSGYAPARELACGVALSG